MENPFEKEKKKP